MKKTGILVVLALVIGMFCASDSRAEREAVGKVTSFDRSRMVVETAERDKLRLEITERTRIFLEDGAVPTKRVMIGSVVRVVYSDRHADTIFVKAVPK